MAKRNKGSRTQAGGDSNAAAPQAGAPGGGGVDRRIWVPVLWAVIVAGWLLAVLALVSHDPADWPGHSVVPQNVQPANWVGWAGAYLSHKLYLMIGPGVWVFLAGGLAFMIFAALKQPVTQPAVRGVGVVAMGLTTSALVAAMMPGAGSQPQGAGGLIAIAITQELWLRFGTPGTLVILAIAFWIGAIMAMDAIVMAATRAAGRGLLALRGLKVPKPVLIGRFRQGQPALVPAAGGGLAGGAGEVRFQSAGGAATLDEQAPASFEEDPDSEAYIPRGPVGTALAEGDEALPEVSATVEESPEELAAAARKLAESVAAPDPDARPDGDAEPEAGGHDAPGAYVAERRLDPEALKAKIRALPINFAPKAKTAPAAPREIDLSGYRFPGLDLLIDPEHSFTQEMEKIVRDQAVILEQALQQYRIDGEVVGIDSGPVITLYEVRLAPGTKVSALGTVASDLARALKSQNVRIVPNTAGKDTVGIEVPNIKKERVRLKELMTVQQEQVAKMHLPMFLGKDASGAPLIDDLTKMPHMLIAGTTGSGKSVCMNSIIMSFLFTRRPDELKLVLVDPKMVELSMFKDIPHLMCPVVTEMGKAAAILEWATTKMDERYELLAEAGVRDVAGYNQLSWEELKERFKPANEAEEARIPKKLPYLVFVVDELADLIITNKEVEGFIVRLAQKARAVGLHLILATQRPQANVVTGLIKGNMPCRVSFKVASGLDSRIVLDQKGAELLLGQGDMLFLSPRSSRLTRAQGTLVDDLEIRRTVGFLKDIAEQNFEPQLMQIRSPDAAGVDEEAARDPLFQDAVEVVLESKRGSVSLLQRRLTIGYSRASRLIEAMAAGGILGEYKGSQAREVAISLDDWEAMKAQMAADAAANEAKGTVFEGVRTADSPDLPANDWANEGDDEDSDGVPDEFPDEHRR